MSLQEKRKRNELVSCFPKTGMQEGIISGLSPESSLIVICFWQVFWLGVYFNAFPFFKTVAKIETSL